MTLDPALPSPPPQPDAGKGALDPPQKYYPDGNGMRPIEDFPCPESMLPNYVLYDDYEALEDRIAQLEPSAPAPPGPAAAVESALHAALAERDANAQTAKAMSRLHDDAEKEIEELHASLAELAERGRGASRLAALERVAAEARKLATVIPATSGHLDGLNEAIRVLDGGT